MLGAASTGHRPPSPEPAVRSQSDEAAGGLRRKKRIRDHRTTVGREPASGPRWCVPIPPVIFRVCPCNSEDSNIMQKGETSSPLMRTYNIYVIYSINIEVLLCIVTLGM